MSLRFETLTGDAVEPVIDDLAALRIKVFAEFPYLYDGDLDYERRYLRTYRDSAGAVVVGAFDGDRLVGAATGTPMTDHEEDFAKAFDGTGYDLNDVFYCAESVLLPEYRGRGAGHAFFDRREAHARKLGARHNAFCAVIRPKYHPDRPEDYAPLDPFWRKRGYEKLDGAVAEFSWRDHGDAEETKKPLQFWIRAL